MEKEESHRKKREFYLEINPNFDSIGGSSSDKSHTKKKVLCDEVFALFR